MITLVVAYKQSDSVSIQRNVQQENKLRFDSMLAEAQVYRTHGLALGVRQFFARQGIDIDTSIIFDATVEGYLLGLDFGMAGMLLTAQHRFYSFELELDAALTEVIFVHEFVDVTSEQNLSANNRGIGKGRGALAIDVLNALGRCAP